MAVEEWFDTLFSTATGWLGWVPELVLDTPICQLELALEGKIDFVKKTNIFGSGEETEEEKLKKAVPAPEIAARQLIDFVQRRQQQNARLEKK